ncbi:uncharacterized protein [Haliotis asinina]|uniref:uncharacterized protein n=1 Tax=Haliotis asinina TaxID=109174 RepID=UPI0035319748
MACSGTLWVFVVCVVFLQSDRVHGKTTTVYMDSEDSCSYKVHLNDEDVFHVENLDRSKPNRNLTGYFPCFQAFVSGSQVVCINEHIVHFHRCSLHLKYYTFDTSLTYVPITTDYTADRILDCNMDTTEWCSREARNVKIVLEATQPDASIRDVSFLMDVSRITSQNRFVFMFNNCGTKHYLKNSRLHMKLLDTDDASSCVKTFRYRDVDDSKKAEICVKFEEWPRENSCSSFELFMYHGSPDGGDLIKSVKCSEASPENFCTDGEEISFKAIRTGSVDTKKYDFHLKIWDNHDLSGGSPGLSAGNIVLIVLGVVIVIVLIGLIIMCRLGKCKGSGGGTRSWSMPSLPSFDDDD